MSDTIWIYQLIDRLWKVLDLSGAILIILNLRHNLIYCFLPLISAMISNVIFLLLAKAGMRSMGASGIDYGILGIILAIVLMNSTSGVEFYFRKMCRAIVDKYKLRLTIMNLMYILSIALTVCNWIKNYGLLHNQTMSYRAIALYVLPEIQ